MKRSPELASGQTESELLDTDRVTLVACYEFPEVKIITTRSIELAASRDRGVDIYVRSNPRPANAASTDCSLQTIR